MLIGIDASRAASAQRTGVENYALYLTRALVQLGDGHRFRLYFAEMPEDGLFPRDERVEWRVIPFPRLWTHVRLALELALHPPDLFYVPSHVIPWLHPRRCVATVHDLGYLRYPQTHTRCARAYLDWSTRHNVRASRRVIADSEATRRDLTAYYHVNPAHIHVAYPAGAEGFAPISDVTVLDAVRQRYHAGEDYFLYVGTLQPRKNLDTLIRAFAQAAAGSALPPDVRLVLAGKRGWLERDILTRAQALGIEDRVVFTGYVPSEDLPALLSGATAFVLPSWHEGFGLPLLEAMACDTPVLCSNASSLPEVAGDAALMFDPADVGGIADAMLRVYADADLRQTMVARGRMRVQAFSWERCARDVLSVLESAGAGK